MTGSFLIAAAALAFSGTAPQDASTPQEDEVVVVGSREVEEAARDMVGALSGGRGAWDTDPIGRLDDRPVCPGVVGLSPQRNAEIASRIRDVAAAARLRVATAECRPNVLVMFTRDKNELMRGLRQRHSAFFRDGAGETIEIPDQPGPVVAWHVDRLVDRDGQPVPFDAEAGYYVVNSSVGPSRLNASVRPVFAAALVVIELDSVVGLSATQVADYAAMRAFTQADPGQVRRLGVPTILTAIETPEGSPVPITLTQWDLSYLRALAATPVFNYAPRQRTDLRRRLLSEMEAQRRGQ